MKGIYQVRNSQCYWFRFRVNGKEYRRSTGESDEAKAIEAARRMLETPPIETADVLETEIDAFVKSRSANYRRDSGYVLKSFAEAMAGLAVRDITPERIRAWTGSLEVKASTREAYRFQIQKLFDWFIENGKARTNPAREVEIADVEERSTRKVWINKRNWPAIFAACQDLELKFALYAGLHAGLRLEEVIMFRPEWIDRNVGAHGVINVTFAENWKPKDGTERTIPISPEFRDFLDNGFPRLPGPYMIAPFKVKKPGDRYRVEFRTKFRNFRASDEIKKLELGHFTFHDLRRSFASNLVSGGVSIYKVAKWLGDDVDVVQRTYGHLDPSDDELAGIFGPGPDRPANVVEMKAARG